MIPADNAADPAADQDQVTRPSDTIPATAALTSLSIVTAIGFCRIFAGWDFVGPMLVVVIGVHAVALVFRLLKVNGYVAIPATLLTLFVLIAWKYYPGTMSGPFPTSTTWQFIDSDLQLARDQFPSALAPVAAVGGFVVAAATAAGVAALLSDAFAFRAYGRVEAAVPSAVLFIFSAALGVNNHRVVLTAAWLAAALAVIAALRMTHSRSEHAWIGRPARVLLSVIPLVVVLAGCAALSGAIVGPRLPGAGAEALLNTRSHSNVTEVLSPLVDIRSRLVNQSAVPLFTVASSEPHYWRSTGLSEFNGTTWGIPDGTEGGSFPVPPPGAQLLRQTVRIQGLAGNLLPAAYSATSVSGGKAYYVPLTGTIVEPTPGLERDAAYRVVSAVPVLSPDVLRAATSSRPPDPLAMELPPDFPGSVATTAADVTGAKTTVYDKAIALQQWFRENFTYDLSVQRGHSDNALENFLRIRRGYCEQFSAAFAAMARAVGIPARVAVGFTSGDLGSDGLYHVYGRNAHAWPEVWFDGIGWVAFEPTPGRGEPGAESYTGVAPQQASAADTPATNTEGTTPAAVTTTTTAGAGAGTAPASTVADVAPTPTTIPNQVIETATPGQGGLSTASKLLITLLVAVLAWALLLPRALQLLASRRADRTPARHIEQSWHSAARALRLIKLGPLAGETPIEHAERVARRTGIDRRMLADLARAATAAIYGDVGDEAGAARCARDAANVVAAVRNRLTPTNRVLARIDPRRAALLIAV